MALDTVKQLVEDNPQELFLGAARLLLKFADNVINNPNEPKYRKIRLGNPMVETKLLPVSGALECLFEMGFIEDGEFLTLPQSSSLAIIRQIRMDLNSYIQSMERDEPMSPESTQQPDTTTAPSPMAAKPDTDAAPSPVTIKPDPDAAPSPTAVAPSPIAIKPDPDAAPSPSAATPSPNEATPSLTPATPIPIAVTQNFTAANPNPVAAIQTPIVATPNPAAALQTPIVATPNPAAALQTPFIVTPNPAGAFQTPIVATPNPAAAVQTPTVATPNPLENMSQQEINPCCPCENRGKCKSCECKRKGCTNCRNPCCHFKKKIQEQMEKRFFVRIESSLVHVLMYEDPRLQQKAKSIIPVDNLKKEAHRKLEEIKKADSTAATNVDFRDLMLLELLSWFKNSFFRWVDAPKCDNCGGDTQSVGMAEPTPYEIRWQANRVENYKCNRCQRFVRFPRYNHPEKLLETRCGRCGEWANCFTLCCRAVGFEARYVLDWTDHVWTEVYSQIQKRWLHCDPCENVCDKPLLYEAGWGKKLTYVLAFSKDEVQDVSWRYSAKHSEMLSRRKECRESWLVQVIHRLWKAREPRNSPERNQEMKMRLLTELVEFMSPKSSEGQTLTGRTTGSLAWRLARGEMGSQPPSNSEPFVFKLTDDEKKSKMFHLKYSGARDEYIRVTKNGEVTKSFSSCLNKQQNIFRKEERDWRMVYLARTEGSSTAAISWKFDFSGMKIDTVEICAASQAFQNGVISWRLCSKNQCALLTGAPEIKSYTELSGEDQMTLTAMMSGGNGDVAWQHTQLFRQKMDDTGFYPLDIKVYFK